ESFPRSIARSRSGAFRRRARGRAGSAINCAGAVAASAGRNAGDGDRDRPKRDACGSAGGEKLSRHVEGKGLLGCDTFLVREVWIKFWSTAAAGFPVPLRSAAQK